MADQSRDVRSALASIPKCIQAANQLCQFREYHKDASPLISAIHNESMVIAASVTQLQGLLQRKPLHDRPDLVDMFDNAITGCRVTYACLQEEVDDLLTIVDEGGPDRKDRIQYLWKEETFRGLLDQIRSQRTALSLLIQALQMESNDDVSTLLRTNSSRLSHTTKRSSSLRNDHPNISVPESVFSDDADKNSMSGPESEATEFTFDHEVTISEAYRRAIALVLKSTEEQDCAEVIEDGLADANSIAVTGTPEQLTSNEPVVEPTVEPAADPVADPVAETKLLELTTTSHEYQQQEPNARFSGGLEDPLDSQIEDLEKMLPFMFPMRTDSPICTNIETASPRSTNFSDTFFTPKAETFSTPRADTFSTPITETFSIPGVSGKDSIRSPAEESFQEEPKLAIPSAQDDAKERPPPLPPRRPFLTLRKASEDRGKPLPAIPVSARPSPARFLPEVDTSFISFGDDTDLSLFENSPTLTRTFIISQPDALSSPGSEGLSSPSAIEDETIHAIWMTLIAIEEKFVKLMHKMTRNFHKMVLREWPILEKHIVALTLCTKLAAMHEEYLLTEMELQTSLCPNASCQPKIFKTWARNAGKLYREYAQLLPHAESSLRLTQSMDPRFSSLVDTLNSCWEDCVRMPFLQLDLYTQQLEELHSHFERITIPGSLNAARVVEQLLDIIQGMKTTCHRVADESAQREELQSTTRSLQSLKVDLGPIGLFQPKRRLLHQGSLAMKVKGSGPWRPVRAVLLDNYLIWGVVKSPRIGKNMMPRVDDIWVMKPPIPTPQLAVFLRKGARPDAYKRATILDEVPTGLPIYEFFVRDMTGSSKSHALGAHTPAQRQEWLDKLHQVVAENSASTLAPRKK